MDQQAEENPVAVTLADRVTRATWRLSKLRARGVELYEILGGEAGATFIYDYCEGDPEVAYTAITTVYSPSTHGSQQVGEQGEADGSKRPSEKGF